VRPPCGIPGQRGAVGDWFAALERRHACQLLTLFPPALWRGWVIVLHLPRALRRWFQVAPGRNLCLLRCLSILFVVSGLFAVAALLLPYMLRCGILHKRSPLPYLHYLRTLHCTRFAGGDACTSATSTDFSTATGDAATCRLCGRFSFCGGCVAISRRLTRFRLSAVTSGCRADGRAWRNSAACGLLFGHCPTAAFLPSRDAFRCACAGGGVLACGGLPFLLLLALPACAAFRQARRAQPAKQSPTMPCYPTHTCPTPPTFSCCTHTHMHYTATIRRCWDACSLRVVYRYAAWRCHHSGTGVRAARRASCLRCLRCWAMALFPHGRRLRRTSRSPVALAACVLWAGDFSKTGGAPGADLPSGLGVHHGRPSRTCTLPRVPFVCQHTLCLCLRRYTALSRKPYTTRTLHLRLPSSRLPAH